MSEQMIKSIDWVADKVFGACALMGMAFAVMFIVDSWDFPWIYKPYFFHFPLFCLFAIPMVVCFVIESVIHWNDDVEYYDEDEEEPPEENEA